ncbi:unnamed protein product [Cylicocyclus nassatus]|uniref:Uncharacterized protein n=1 Tax=Cylicocyclus nassatus TaxID=53992 RepID=A0AA36H2Y7_CYLNA|nr:unnamed protein product [Cylicocyclus nassatus]
MVAGISSLVISSSDGHVLITDTPEHSTTIEEEELVKEVETKQKEEASKERRRKISLHLLMLSLFLVTLSVSQLICMSRLREKYLHSPPEGKGKSQSIIETASPSQSPLPGQISRQTPASSLRSGKGSQKSGKKTLDFFNV